MKKFLALAAAVALTAAAPEAKADGCRRFIGYDSYGRSLYSVSYVAGYDHCGRPIWHTRTEACGPIRSGCDRGYGGYAPRTCGPGYPSFSVRVPHVSLSFGGSHRGHGHCR